MIRKVMKDELLIGNLISNFMYSLAYPTIHYVLINSVNESIISLNSIVICLGGIIIPSLWNKHSDTIYKKYGYILLSEIILYVILITSVLLGLIDNRAFYILDTFLLAIVTKNIICGANKLISIRYKNKEREEYDNNLGIIANTSSLLGFGISFFLTLNVNIAFILFGIGLVSDNIFYYIAYKNQQRVKTTPYGINTNV